MLSFYSFIGAFLLFLDPQAMGLEIETNARRHRSLNSRGIPEPWFRYTLWSDLDTDAVSNAVFLGYTETDWNLPGSLDLEYFAYQYVPTNLTEAILNLGFTSEIWDCYMVHYTDISWDGLVLLGVHTYWEGLGWTEDKWNGVDPVLPASDDAFWDELTTEEQTAAEELCYRRETWNFVSLELWPTLPQREAIPPTPAPTESPTAAPGDSGTPTDAPIAGASEAPSALATTAFPTSFLDDNVTMSPTPFPTTASPTPFPTTPSPTISPAPTLTLPPYPVIDSVDDIRYVLWEDLDTEAKINAQLIAYTEESWHNPGTAAIEDFSFASLEAAGIEDGREAATALGFSEETWDCHINHYTYFSWGELEQNGTDVYWMGLGWSAEKWEGDAPEPESNSLAWEELSPREQEAAMALCYRQELWDGIPLTEWEESSDNSGSSSPANRLGLQEATKWISALLVLTSVYYL